ncbi:class I SAM-dependent methyltransferase [Cellulomonas alba]|uniref:Class I SAM-dependent methyltransferase n=1 Tax=Cellulomonas alba TaxID=3053467 RepID=A0ABT7SBQ2_9CELL|nr:class I SAM-dependent methyltransferase [Cellulomonas alba]MDM7853611.1 class I SAM-dependent methyltransferase [Cellulomonas alba]
MTGPQHFDRHASLYTRARPPYPAALWGELAELGLLQPGGRVLDLGAGTGQATGPLLDAGMRVTAVEPGPALAAELRERYPDAVVLPSTAESAVLDAASFDLAVCATAVHWLDLDLVLPRLHDALADGGHLAVWMNEFGDPAVTTPFRERVGDIVARRGAPPRTERALDPAEWPVALTAGGHFEVVTARRFRWSVRLSSDQVRDLFTTFSNWSAAEVDEAADAARELGGVVTEHYATPLIVLRRR